MHPFFHGIMSIFFDMSTYGEIQKDIFDPQDLTDHYKNEIPKMNLDAIYVATHYKDIRYTIESYKYRSDRKHAWEYVDLLSKTGDIYWLFSNTSDICIVGVPMHWSRYLIRGFNHIDYLVSRLSKKTGILHAKPLQSFFTRRQSKLSKSKRIKNRECAFWLTREKDLPKTIILIDDIISTGSTADACAKILKSRWVEKVYGIFIASNQ
jgi:ComF family protein